MISSICLRCRPAWPSHQTSRSPIGAPGTCRALFDCPDLLLTPTGPRIRVIVATHPATALAAPIGTTRGEVVYELFFTALPQEAFTPADVVALAPPIEVRSSAFSGMKIKNKIPTAGGGHTASGQEFWQVLSQWIWNLRLQLGHMLHAPAMRTTEFAPAEAAPNPVSRPAEPAPVIYGPPQWARQSSTKGFAGTAFSLQPDGTLRCPCLAPPLCARTAPRT